MELIVHPHRYNFKVSLKTYFLTIARNKSVDYIEHNSLIQITPIDDNIYKSAEYESFEIEVLRDEKHMAVHNAIGQMNENFRTVIHLIYFEGLSYEEAGKVMAKNRKQIENLAHLWVENTEEENIS